MFLWFPIRSKKWGMNNIKWIRHTRIGLPDSVVWWKRREVKSERSKSQSIKNNETYFFHFFQDEQILSWNSIENTHTELLNYLAIVCTFLMMSKIPLYCILNSFFISPHFNFFFSSLAHTPDFSIQLDSFTRKEKYEKMMIKSNLKKITTQKEDKL